MVLPSRLEHRTEDRVRAFLVAAKLPALAHWVFRERLDDKPVYDPKSGVPPKPVVVLTAKDEGRVSVTPIRKISVEIVFHANGHTPGGSAGALDAAVGAVEQLLDGTNLIVALSDPASVAIMLARRQDGSSIHFDGLVRRATLRLDLRAVAAERCAQG